MVQRMHRRGRRRAGTRSRSCRRGRRTCSRATSTSRTTSVEPSRSGCTALVAHRHRHAQRRAVRGHGRRRARRADDPRRRADSGRTGSDAWRTSLTGAKHLRTPAVPRRACEVDGVTWFDGKAGCMLVGNVGKIFGGIEVFPDADPADGRLELGVVTAKGVDAVDAGARPHRGRRAPTSQFVQVTSRRRRSASSSTARCPSSSTAATGSPEDGEAPRRGVVGHGVRAGVDHRVRPSASRRPAA